MSNYTAATQWPLMKIEDKITELYEHFGLAEARSEETKESCEYLRDGKCVATSQTSCRDCRFYSPTRAAKTQAVMEYSLILEDKIARERKARSDDARRHERALRRAEARFYSYVTGPKPMNAAVNQ